MRLRSLVPSLLLCASFLSLAAPVHAGEEGAPHPLPHDAFPEGKKSFEKAMKILLEKYVDQGLTADDLYRDATAGMLEHAGERAWDQVLAPSEMADMTSSLAGEVVGIGVSIKFDADTGMVSVLEALPDSAAARAGMQGGDQILRIDGKSYKGATLREVVGAIRGKAGDPVTLTVLRDARVFTLTIRREKVEVQTVSDAMLPGDVGVLEIDSFNEKTPAMVKAALGRIGAAHARGLIVDLRNCPGGLFERALDVAALLLPEGSPVVTEIGRGGAKTPFVTKGAPVLSGVPMVALVDGKTASGGEILAGALKAAGAKVVGEKTFGKWNVQFLDELGNGWAVKFTVGVFETPAGERLDGTGLLPDLEADLEPGVLDRARRTPDAQARLALDSQLRLAVAALTLH